MSTAAGDRQAVAAGTATGDEAVIRIRTLRNTEVELFSIGGHDGILREVNEAFAALLGRRVEEVNGRSVLEFVHPDDLTATVTGIADLERGEAELLMENRFRHFDGHAVHLQWVARPLPGTPTWWAAGRDTTQFHRLLARHLDLRAGLDLALGHSAAAMWDLDVKTGQFNWEPEAQDLLGAAGDALPSTAQQLADLVHADDSAALLRVIDRLSSSGAGAGAGAADVTVRVEHDPSWRHLSFRGKVLTRGRRGEAVRAVGLLLDVTAEKAMEEQLLAMAMNDALTGICNRRAFDQTLRTEWRRCARARQPLSVLMIDIDDFKRFNDTFGHLVGDAALIAVARAFTGGLNRAGDLLARYGGEEFAVILPDVDARGAAVVADRLLHNARTLTMRQAAGWQVTASIGAATCTPGVDLTNAAELIARADAALYQAKAAGKNRAHPPATPPPADPPPTNSTPAEDF